MRYLYCLLLFLFSCSTPFITFETKTYGNGVDHWYYADGALETVIRPNGKCVRYWENGNLKEELDYRKGTEIIDGKYKNYYENGTIKTEIDYVNGVRQGKFKSYYGNGQVELDVDYVGGVMDGKYMYYDYPGRLQEEMDFKVGQCNGQVKRYYEGKQYYEATCVDDNITKERYM